MDKAARLVWQRGSGETKLTIKTKTKVYHAGVIHIPSMFSLLTQHRLPWLSYVRRMQDRRIPKTVLYVELATSSRPEGRPILCNKDVCKETQGQVILPHNDGWRQMRTVPTGEGP